MNIMQNKLLLAIALLILVNSDAPYRKIIPNLDPQAKCLDGSPGGLYIHQGSEPKKFMIMISGGGSCARQSFSSTLESCWKRSKERMGSSTLWPEEYFGEGMISTNPAKSRFAEWTKVLFMYCDGVLHQGYRKEPYEYKGDKLYFRGNTIMKQHLKWLDIKYNISNAENVVFSGVSAGGWGVYLWSNYLRAMLKTPTVLSNIIDSSLLVNSTTYPGGFGMSDILARNVFKIANIDEDVPLELCARKFPSDQYKCFFLGLAFSAIESRSLFIDSQYDQEELTVQMAMKCVQPGNNGYTLKNCSEAQLNHIKENTKMRRSAVSNFLMFSRNSVWSIACSGHGYTHLDAFFDAKNQRVPMDSNRSVKDAVERYIFSQERVTEVDDVDWPNNEPCAF